MIYIVSLLIGLINAYRGSGKAKENPILKHVFSKWVCVVYFLALMFLVAGSMAMAFIIPIIFLFVTGTGGLMPAFASNWNGEQPEEFYPFDWICNKMVEVKSEASYRAWGCYYGTLVGGVFFIPFLFTNLFYGLPMLLTGLIIGSLRYLPDTILWKWRLIEGVWFGLLYSLLFGFSV